MFCKNCGANIPDDSKVCTVCGVPVEQQQPDFQQPAQEQPVYQQPVYQQPVYQSPAFSQPIPQMATVPGKGMAVASLVLGIVSLVFFCVWYIALTCGVVGLILGCVAMSKAKSVGMRSGLAVAGLVCSCIGVGLMVLLYGMVIVGLAEIATWSSVY